MKHSRKRTRSAVDNFFDVIFAPCNPAAWPRPIRALRWLYIVPLVALCIGGCILVWPWSDDGWERGER